MLKNKQFQILSLFTFFNVVLIVIRLDWMNFDFSQIQTSRDLFLLNGTTTFLFLIWNLFLAWVPYGIALQLEKVYTRTKSIIILGLCLFCWLLFLPNAPYIITDLLHIKARPLIPLWFDVLMLFSYAWTGLLLGIYSLKEVEDFIAKQFSNILSKIIILSAIGLSGLGIYIGRFLRWNSWDILTDPRSLANDLLGIILRPSAFQASGSIPIIAIFFLLSYWAITSRSISEQ